MNPLLRPENRTRTDARVQTKHARRGVPRGKRVLSIRALEVRLVPGTPSPIQPAACYRRGGGLSIKMRFHRDTAAALFRPVTSFPGPTRRMYQRDACTGGSAMNDMNS